MQPLADFDFRSCLDPLWRYVMVTGRLRTEPTRNDLASASYVSEATQVEPYTPKQNR